MFIGSVLNSVAKWRISPPYFTNVTEKKCGWRKKFGGGPPPKCREIGGKWRIFYILVQTFLNNKSCMFHKNINKLHTMLTAVY